MKFPEEFYILLLQLIGKHSQVKDDYSLIRYFAKSTYWENQPILAARELIEKGFLKVKKVDYTIRYYEITENGKQFLGRFDLPKYLDAFALEIDKTGFIKRMCYLLEGKESEL
jgi:hypothetical protein